MRPLIGCCGWLLAGAGFALGMPAAAQEAGPADGALHEARDKYERAVEDIRREVRRTLSDRKTALEAKANPSIEQLKKLEAERDAFESRGDWPTGMGIAPLQSRMSNETKALVAAYATAKSAYARSNLRAAEALDNELAAIRSENDLLPWGVNGVAAMPAAARVADAKGAVVSVARCDSPHYRVEVRAKRIDGDGPLVIELPLPDGKRLTVRAAPSGASEVRALVAVRAGSVSAEMGLSRPVDIAAAVKDESDKLTLRAEQSRYQVEWIGFKPIVAAVTREKKPAPAKPANAGAAVKREKKTPPGIQALLPLNSRWQGVRTRVIGRGDTQVDATVKEHFGTDEVRLKVVGSGDFEMSWTLKGNGANLHIASFRELQRGRGRRSNVKGQGSCDGKYLVLEYEWTLDHGDKKNQLVRGELRLERKN